MTISESTELYLDELRIEDVRQCAELFPVGSKVYVHENLERYGVVTGLTDTGMIEVTFPKSNTRKTISHRAHIVNVTFPKSLSDSISQ